MITLYLLSRVDGYSYQSAKSAFPSPNNDNILNIFDFFVWRSSDISDRPVEVAAAVVEASDSVRSRSLSCFNTSRPEIDYF